MPNINTIDSEAFSYMVKDNVKTLPNLFFRKNLADVATVVNTLASAIEAEIPDVDLEGDAREDYVAEKVLELYSKMKHDPKHGALFAPLSSIANSLGESISRTFNVLKTDVSPGVADLKEQVESDAIQELEDSDVKEDLSEFREMDDISDSMKIVRWDKMLATFGGSDVLDQDYTDITEMEPTETNSDIQMLMLSKKLNISDLDIHPDMAAHIKEAMLGKCFNEIQREDMRRLLEMTFDKYAYDTAKQYILGEVYRSNDYASAIKNVLKNSKDLLPVLAIAEATPLNVPTSVLEMFHTNLTAVKKLIMSGGYVLKVMRRHWKNALVLSESLVNGDNTEEMVENGVTDSDVQMHVKMLHRDRKIGIPFEGIVLSKVKEDKAAVHQLYETAKKKHSELTETVKARAIAKSLRKVLTCRLEATSPDKLKDDSLNEFVKKHTYLVDKAVNSLDTTEDNNLDNVLYDFVLSMWYDGTMVQKANTLFGEEVVKQLELRTELTDSELTLIDTRVAAKIAAEFLANHVVTAE